jgi:hypothetical protein
MLNLKKWIKIIYIIPITLLSCSYRLISKIQNIPISTMLSNEVLGQVSNLDVKQFIFIFDNFYFLILFNILFGNIIYEDFRYSSTYLFSRIKNRKHWFYKKSLELLAISAFYTIIYLVTHLLICLQCSNNKIDTYTIHIVLLLFIMFTTLLTLTTLVINIISIRYGNTIGYIVVYISIVILVFIALNSQNISFMSDKQWLLMLNPMYSIILDVNTTISLQLIMIFYYILLIILSIVIGARFINTFDIALIDYECD